MARKDSKAEADKQSKLQKTRFAMELQSMQTKQKLAINDVNTAAKIQTDRMKAAQSNGKKE
jgi:hypothetical protein